MVCKALMNKQGRKHGELFATLGTGVVHRPSWDKRLRRWLKDYQWPLIGLMWITAILLGYVGFNKYSIAIGEAHSFWHNLYRTLQLFTLESGAVTGPIGWELQVARLLAPAMAVYTALRALAIILHEQLQLFRVRFLKNHVIITGLGRKGLLLSEGSVKEENRLW